MLITGTLPAATVLKIGSEIDAYVTHIDSSHQFAVHIVGSSPLIGMINLWGRQLETGAKQLSVDSISVGLSYLVKNPIDDQWCRGTLNKIDNERKIVRLYSVDFGDMLELPFADIGSKLMLLGNRLAAFPPLAVLCVWDSDAALEMGAELKKCLDTKTVVKMQILSSIDNGGYRVEILDLQKPDSQEEKDVSFTSQEFSSLSPVHEQNGEKLESGIVIPADTVDGNIEVEPEPTQPTKEEKINERVQAPLYRAPPRREPNSLNETNKPSTEDKTAEVFKKLVQEANRDAAATIPKESVKVTENDLTSTNSSGTSVTASVNGNQYGAAGRIENEERMNKLVIIKEVLEADAVEREIPATPELSTELMKDQVIIPPTAPTFDKDLLKKALVQLFNDEEFLDTMVGKLSASFGN